MGKSEYSKLFSSNLNYYLNINQKTQADLAHDLKISKATISSWCNGTRVPRPEKVDLLCSYFNIRRSDLMESMDCKLNYDLLYESKDPDLEFLIEFYRSSSTETKAALFAYAKLLHEKITYKED